MLLFWPDLRPSCNLVYPDVTVSPGHFQKHDASDADSLAGLLVPGRQIAPHLRLVRALGEGGMGRVWVAEHQTLESEVAVKLLNPELAQDDQWLARFRREAQAIAQIDSAHVVRVFDHGVTTDQIPFIVMELLRGEDLRRRIERLHGLPISEVILILNQTCKALGRAHALGIVHRDIKPENIFLTHEGEELFVKVLDFGIAKRIAAKGMDVTDVHSVFGTPYYMSPEQALSTGGVDQRADLWALAVVTFQMLTGERPFVGSTPGAIYVQINAGTFELPSLLRSELPPAVDKWFKLALNRDIGARFVSAEEMFQAFRRAFQVPAATSDTAFASKYDKTQTSNEQAVTATSSAHTIGDARPRSRGITLLGVAILMIGITMLSIGLGRRGHRHSLETTASNASPSPPTERTTGLALLPSSSALEQAQIRPLDATGVPSLVSAPTPSAHFPPSGVKGKRAVAGPSSLPSVSAPAEQRPIKDRGF